MEGPEAAPSLGARPQLGGPVLLPAECSQSVLPTNELCTFLPHSGDLLRACFLPRPSTPSATACKESWGEFLPFSPERTGVTGEPPEVLAGDISLEGCQGQRAKGTQLGWHQVAWFERKQHCGSEECCSVAGKRRNAEILERNQPLFWCPEHLPRVTLVLPGKPWPPTEATLLLAAPCLRKEGPYAGASEEEALSSIFSSEHLQKKSVISGLGCCCSLLWASLIFLERFL